MKYCECKEPKLKTNEAYGKEFQVCSKRLGGCGKEYFRKPQSYLDLLKNHINEHMILLRETDPDITCSDKLYPKLGLKGLDADNIIVDEWDDIDDIPF